MSSTPSPRGEDLVARLVDLRARLVAIAYPDRSDLVGRELTLIDGALSCLLRELGQRDSVSDR